MKRTETGTPPSVAGANRQPATASSSAPSSIAPADSRIATSITSPVSLDPDLDHGRALEPALARGLGIGRQRSRRRAAAA